jgi:hypothetical protein
MTTSLRSFARAGANDVTPRRGQGSLNRGAAIISCVDYTKRDLAVHYVHAH